MKITTKGRYAYHLPGRKRPFAHSTTATHDFIIMLSKECATVKECRERIGTVYLRDADAEKILDYYIKKGYGDENARNFFSPNRPLMLGFHNVRINGKVERFNNHHWGSDLVDMNGREIFEGDMVRCCGILGVVYFKKGKFRHVMGALELRRPSDLEIVNSSEGNHGQDD